MQILQTIRQYSLLLFLLIVLSSCSSDDNETTEPKPETVELNSEINDFVWQGLNVVYLYKAEVPNLANDRFPSLESNEYYKFLNSYSTPESLFEDLLVEHDRFSIIVDDYVELENAFAGNTNTNGLEFGLTLISKNSDDVLGYVNYIANGSDASTKDIKRGDLFTKVNGIQLNRTNYRELLFGSNDTYTLTKAKIENNTIVETGEVTLTKSDFTENPVHTVKTLTHNNTKVGYILYNAFIGTDVANRALNDAFGQLKADGVKELVLDLRYNGGGSVQSATWLGSMITGQFNGEVYAKYRYNKELQAQFDADNPEESILRFTNTMLKNEPINSLNLEKVYVLVSGDTASASELIINGLSAYINVITIGDNTVGKSQASITVYDSENLGRENANPNHTYAMQPLIITTVNSKGEIVPNEGYVPTTDLGSENIENLGVLGDKDEPYLAEALSQISGSSRSSREFNTSPYEQFKSSADFKLLPTDMYIDKSLLLKTTKE